VYPSQLRTTARRRYSKSTKHLPFQWQPARSDPSVIHVAYTVNGRRGGVDRIGDMNNGPADECAFPDRNRVQLFFTSSSSPIVRAGRCSSSRMGGLFHPHPRETECRINIVHSCLGSSRSRLELTAAGTLHTAAARSETFVRVGSHVASRSHRDPCYRAPDVWNSAFVGAKSFGTATGTNHRKEKVSTRALAHFACVHAPYWTFDNLHVPFRVTHTKTAFAFCWLIAWHLTHVKVDGWLQQDLESGALFEIHNGLFTICQCQS
jgi:hypothetical protein